MNDHIESELRDYYSTITPSDSTRARTRVVSAIASARTGAANSSKRPRFILRESRTLVGVGLLTVLAVVAALLLRGTGPKEAPAASVETDGPGRFVPTGSMPFAGASEGVLLRDGRVLLLGGDGTSPEVYDPKTEAFAPTGSLANGATEGATLLADGRVLFVGGFDGVGVTAAAQIYDPTTGTFSATGSMATARMRHTATLLADGRVLVAGGFAGSIPSAVRPDVRLVGFRPGDGGQEAGSNAVIGPSFASTELFDPKTGTFSPGPDMATARDYASATRLPDGRVLIAGGEDVYEGIDALASAEIYDPTTSTFTVTGSMETSRFGHQATLLLDGRVLISGGSSATQGVGAIPATSLELYDPTTGTFGSTGAAQANAFGRAALLHDGRVLIVGGFDEYRSSTTYGTHLATCQIYDPATGLVTRAASMEVGRLNPATTTLSDGRVLVAGGVADTILSSAELYVPGRAHPASTPTATEAASSPPVSPLASPSTWGDWKVLAAAFVTTAEWSPDGGWLVVGAGPNDGRSLRQLEIFDRKGNLVRTLDGNSLAWLDANRFVLNQNGSTVLGSMDASTLTPLSPGPLPSVTSSTPPEVIRILVEAGLSNNHGAIAIPEPAEGLDASEFSFFVWTLADETKPRPGYPVAWSPDGTELAVFHFVKPTTPQGVAPQPGWIEVLGWPGLERVAAFGQESAGYFAINPSFDPSGRYLAATTSGGYAVLDTQTGDVTGQVRTEASAAWYQGGLLVPESSSGTVVGYSISGARLSGQGYPGATVASSADGSTAVLSSPIQGPPTPGSITLLRNGQARSIAVPGWVTRIVLALDGSGVVVVCDLGDTSEVLLLGE